MEEKEISHFLSRMATDKNVAASTQDQALNALVFLYKHVLRIDLGEFGPTGRAKRPERVPTLMTRGWSCSGGHVRVLWFDSRAHLWQWTSAHGVGFWGCYYLCCIDLSPRALHHLLNCPCDA